MRIAQGHIVATRVCVYLRAFGLSFCAHRRAAGVCSRFQLRSVKSEWGQLFVRVMRTFFRQCHCSDGFGLGCAHTEFCPVCHFGLGFLPLPCGGSFAAQCVALVYTRLDAPPISEPIQLVWVVLFLSTLRRTGLQYPPHSRTKYTHARTVSGIFGQSHASQCLDT